VKLGSGADLDVVEAETGVGRRNLELLRSEQDIVEAEGRLFDAIGIRVGDPGWDARQAIVPSDTAELESAPIELDRELAVARTKRGDALAAHATVSAEAAELEVTSDRRRPAVDLVLAAGTAGFAGTLAASYATAGVNGPGLDPPYTTDPAYDGTARTAFENALGKDLQIFAALRFEIPLGDHEAEIRHTIQHRVVARARLAERDTLSKIDSEVRTAAARVALDTKLVKAADQAVVLAEKLLDGTRKRFRAGAGTTFDVLRVSEELTRARVEAARVRADYRVSVTRLGAATGTLLDRFGISVKSLGASPR
jgi:outer membrane protein TolC